MTFSKIVYNDEVLFNSDYTKFSLIPLEGYTTWSELCKVQHKGFIFNS